MKIKNIEAREILDSRGNPTIEAAVEIGNLIYTASVPSGASTGKHEAVELRDNEKRYNGKGVIQAVSNIKLISEKLVGMDTTNQKEIDQIKTQLNRIEKKLK